MLVISTIGVPCSDHGLMFSDVRTEEIHLFAGMGERGHLLLKHSPIRIENQWKPSLYRLKLPKIGIIVRKKGTFS